MKLSSLPAEALAKCAHLFEGKANYLELEFPEPTGWHVLVLQYIRPEAKVLPGGGKIYYADKTKTEDEYQGRVGVVLAVGPDAYRDPVKYPSGPWVKQGDWVMWPALESAAQRQRYHGVVIAFLNDDRVVGIKVDPVAAVEAA